ncbi:hypothetical protein FHETE_4652 [Fusarium heterosporum]|uniref:2EXR domain-containing protein n=1 Tax=Fusarium heterosporum TaxID=42747 RepID=A0A8H5TD12_FUSHE|nr:hypothetical protein FHETE_4652 [Fusarium heterosporum]
METEPSNSMFTCFSQLPVELRLMIWEAACLPCPDSRAVLPTKHRRFGKSRLSMERSIRTQTTQRLLSSCRESRDVALASGSFMLVEEMICSIAIHQGVWVDNRFKNLLLPLTPLGDKPLSFIPHNIQSITVLWTDSWYFGAIRDYIVSTPRRGRPCMIETIYIGAMCIPWISSKDDTITTSPCVNSDTTVISFDDEMLPKYVASAYKAHALHILEKSLSEEVCLENAKRYLERNMQLSYKRTVLQYGQRILGAPGMKYELAVIFSSKDQFSISEVARLKQQSWARRCLFPRHSDEASEEVAIFSLGFLWDLI